MPSSCSCSGDSGSLNTPEDSVVRCELSSCCRAVDTGPGKGHSDCSSCNSGTVETLGDDSDVTKSGDDVVVPGEGNSTKGVLAASPWFILYTSTKHSKKEKQVLQYLHIQISFKALSQTFQQSSIVIVSSHKVIISYQDVLDSTS